MMLVPRIYAPETQKLFFDSPVMLNLFTVFILTMVIIILATTDKMPKEAIGTLLGGIAGYVLGSTKRNKEETVVDRPVG